MLAKLNEVVNGVNWEASAYRWMWGRARLVLASVPWSSGSAQQYFRSRLAHKSVWSSVFLISLHTVC